MSVSEVEVAGSKYAPDGRTSAGFVVPGGRGGAIVSEFSRLLQDRRDSARGFLAPVVTVKLSSVKLTADGEYVLLPRGEVAMIATGENSRPTARSRAWEKDPAAAIDSLFEGGDSYKTLPDDLAFQALRVLAESVRADGSACRKLSDMTALLLCVRAGLLDVSFEHLPAY